MIADFINNFYDEINLVGLIALGIFVSGLANMLFIKKNTINYGKNFNRDNLIIMILSLLIFIIVFFLLFKFQKI